MAIDDCERCADWWQLGLSDTCPTCDQIALEKACSEIATEARVPAKNPDGVFGRKIRESRS